MGKQRIVAVSREYGSGGHYIALQLAERLGLSIVDYDVFYEMAKEKGIDLHKMKLTTSRSESRSSTGRCGA